MLAPSLMDVLIWRLLVGGGQAAQGDSFKLWQRKTDEEVKTAESMSGLGRKEITVLKRLDMLLSVLISGCFGREGEMRRSIISFKSRSPFPSLHWVPSSIHFIKVRHFFGAIKLEKKKKIPFFFPSLFLPFAHLHQPLSRCIESGETEKKEEIKDNERRLRRRSHVWINYILKNLSFASVYVGNLNECQLPLFVRLFIVAVSLLP